MDRISKSRRSKNMSKIKSKNTSLEITVRKYLYHRGYRYRIHYNITGKPDLVFPKEKLAIFINGCFWHMHECSFGKIPSTRTEFWKAKLERNRQRDLTVIEKLHAENWEVITIWECFLKNDQEAELLKLEQNICKRNIGKLNFCKKGN
jgi:DNA mismatch endonuclease (patch repair protein)